MFDTVTLIAFNIDININELKDVNTFTFIDDNGEYMTNLRFKKERINYKYRLQKRFLEIELSIPKLIHGTNVRMISVSELEKFWDRLGEVIKSHLKVSIDRDKWKIKRLDVSYNFRVDNVRNYINEISKMNISKRTKMVFNESETVLFKNKSSSICFYDKQQECINSKQPTEIIQKAEGMLRLEIRPASYHLRAYSSSKKAVDLISEDFFEYIIEKFKIRDLLKSISYQSDIEKNLEEMLKTIKVADIEKIIGFQVLVDSLGDKRINNIYKEGTLRNRKELLKTHYSNLPNTKGFLKLEANG